MPDSHIQITGTDPALPMSHSNLKRAALILCTVLLTNKLAVAAADDEVVNSPPENLVITATRSAEPILETFGNIAQLDQATIQEVAAVHPHQLAVQLPGVWISRGSGQEHLTAIRSAVLTGPGSCGAFLIMEDGIPTRPTGFCNVNQLFEIPIALAREIEVIRGPANALYGSNALHGTFNTLLPEPGTGPATRATLEAGANEYWRTSIGWDTGADSTAINAGLVADRDGGFRDDTGYEQIKAFSKMRNELSGGILTTSLSGSWLDQETAGFIKGVDAYRDPAVRFSNPNPEAFRKATSQRVSARWDPYQSGNWDTEYTYLLRHSDMEFLQHFLPGQPTEKNNQTSGGLMFMASTDSWRDSTLTVGIDTEIAVGELDEYQANPTQGSAFLMATRPQGQHYDYSVISYSVAGYGAFEVPLNEDWELRIGARAEYLLYDYDNKMLSGNTRDDGTVCGFGGCLYSRPADRNDSFLNVSPNIGLIRTLSNESSLFFNFSTGFRAPQATELYRLQAQQDVNLIDSEEIISTELGFHHQSNNLELELVAFAMRKSDYILRDSEGLNVSDGKSSHIGIETGLNWQMNDAWYFNLAASFTQHEYRFTRDAGQGEIITKGNEVDTAPPLLGSARIGRDFSRGNIELEWVHNDDYFMDAGNTARYPGHDLINLRTRYDLADDWSVAVRLNNVTDEAYADRADLLSVVDPAIYRYFPGRSRELFVELVWEHN
jgi:iron complex outermembrane receptor protein